MRIESILEDRCEVCCDPAIQKLVTKEQCAMWPQNETVQYIVGRCRQHEVKSIDDPNCVYERILE